MLTLKSPINLITTKDFIKHPLSLSEKIPSNYEMMSADFTPKDLLLLLSVGEEASESGGVGADIITTSNLFASSKVNVAVINNVVNRILMDNSNNFSYQDNVYITSMLHKLGIEDVENFVTEVRNMRQENKAVTEQMNLYTGSKDILKVMNNYVVVGRKLIAEGDKTEPSKKPMDTDVNLWQNIYRRLQSKEIYNIVSSFSHIEVAGSNNFNSTELNLSEYKRVSRTIQNADAKVAAGTFPVALQYTNIYEAEDNTAPLQSESAVINRSVQAAMLHVMGSVITATSSNIAQKNIQVVNITNAIGGSANTTVKRFLQNHSEHSERSFLDYVENNHSFLKMLQIENNILTAVRETVGVAYRNQEKIPSAVVASTDKAIPKTGEFGKAELPPVNTLRLFKLLKGVEKTQRNLSTLSNMYLQSSVLTSVTANIKKVAESESITLLLNSITNSNTSSRINNENKAFTATNITLSNTVAENDETNIENNSTSVVQSTSQNVLKTDIKQEKTDNTTNVNSVHAHVNDMTRFADMVKLNDAVALKHGVEAAQKSKEAVLPLIQHVANNIDGDTDISVKTYTNAIDKTLNSTVVQQIAENVENKITADYASPQNEQNLAASDQKMVTESIEKLLKTQVNISETFNEAFTEADTLKVTNGDITTNNQISYKTEEEINNSTVSLKHQLDMIDSRNKEVYKQTLAATAAVPPLLQNATIDRARTMEGALEAITNPEKVIANLMAEATSPAKNKPPLPPEAEIALKNANPEMRAVYETLLKYSSDPEAALQGGMLKRATEGGLLSDIDSVKSVPLTFPENAKVVAQAATNIATETAVLRHFVEEQGAVINNSTSTIFTNPVNIIYKTPEGKTEEQETTQQNAVNTTTKVTNTFATDTETTNMSEINRVNNTVVTRTTEDISNIVNRTLAKEIGTITDKVYAQMEKRLGMERMRRGRF